MDGALGRQFVTSLKTALFDYLEPYVPRGVKVFLDSDEIGGPALLEPTLAHRLCESLVMILVFTPGYFDAGEASWPAREYKAMLSLEEKRLAALPRDSVARESGLIVPVVFRAPKALPEEIRKRSLYTDFSKYTLAAPDISTQPSYIDKITPIAEKIFDIWTEFAALGEDPCTGCSEFALPDAANVEDIVKRYKSSPPRMPSAFETRR